MTQYTPMIQQYLAIKAQVPDAFLFFRLGDFYELFFEDAINASRELEITLTGRGGGTEEKIPMCGVPYHSADNYISRLIEKGYKAAICEQVEDPSAAKGVVRREIVRIVTPGTVMDGKTLGDASNNYIAAVAQVGGRYGFSACDVSTGELYATSLSDSFQLLIDELNAYGPAEIIGDGPLLDRVRGQIPLTAKSTVFTAWEQAADDKLAPQFGEGAAGKLDASARRVVSLLLAYLHETQKQSLTHIKEIRAYSPQQYMTMDPFTRRNLELVETVRERSRKGSLLWLLDETVTAMGARMLRRWIEKPLMQADAIRNRHDAVETLYKQFILRDDLRTVLKEVYDLERLVARMAYGSANARDMIALRVSLEQVPRLKDVCAGAGARVLERLVDEMDPCSDISEMILGAIEDEPPVSVRDGGMIREGYHDYLDQLREASTNGKKWIAELERSEREATGIKSLKVGYNKVFGYYIEVTKANVGSLPEGRYERKQTLANAERFVTPELKEKEALILEAEDKRTDLEYQLFVDLRERISSQIGRLQKLAEAIAELDVYQSLAAVSASNRFIRPEIGDGYDLHIEEGRHPVVEAVLESGAFIENETKLAAGDGSMLLITGPNMAGKSTYMRQVAVICLMAQIGCFVPASSAKIPIIDRIFTRIGAADDLIGGQSTFMVEMMDIQVMTEKATERSLVIIDELGRGTSTGEGMAIAQAVIEFLHHEIGCKTLVSTHFHELAHLEESLPQLRNYCMAVKESGQQVTFLRKLIRGAASTSYGIYCAQIAGLPDGIISRSYELLQAFEARAAADAPEPGAGSSGGAVPAGAAASLGSAVAAGDIGEAGAPYATPKGAASPGLAGSPVEQLSFFEEAKPAREHAQTPAAKPDPQTRAAIEELKALDLLNITPLQAINVLYELKKKLQS